MTVIKLTLEAARVNANLTQQTAAESLGISRLTLINMEKGRRRIKPIELLAMSQLYGIPVDNFSLPEVTT